MNNKMNNNMFLLSNTSAHINPSNTFENFFVCDSNKLAYSNCLDIANNYKTYCFNPLFIYGDTGLGKTHLLQAIANKVLMDNKVCNVLYISCQDFVNRYLDAIKEKYFDLFKEKDLNIDLLIIDDIDVIGGRYETQNIVYDIFNSLIGMNKKMVLSSNKSFNKLDGIKSRILSRFSNVLKCSIKMPSIKDRVVILRKMEKQYKLDCKIDDEIIDYIAKNITSNIRELEGCLNIIANAIRLWNKPIDISISKDLLSDRI